MALFGITSLFFGYQIYSGNLDYIPYGIVSVIGVTVSYILAPQLDYLWYKKNPPKLDGPIIGLIQSKVPFYSTLGREDKNLFIHRVALFNFGKSYEGVKLESIPEDIKAIIAISAVQISFFQEDFMWEDYEKIFIYPHPFPSPQYPKEWHTTEHFKEDGAILFSAKELIHGFLEPQKYFPISTYEMARIYMERAQINDFSFIESYTVEQFCQWIGFEIKNLKAWIGLKLIDKRAIALVLYFHYPMQLKSQDETLYTSIEKQLKKKLPTKDKA